MDVPRQPIPLCVGWVGREKPEGYLLRAAGLGLVNEQTGEEANHLMASYALL